MSSTTIHKLLVTGSTGLVGSRFVDLNKKDFSIVTLGRRNTDVCINLISEAEVSKAILSSDADALINFAAYTNVDQAEEEKGDTKGEVYALNTLLPFWLARSCQNSGKKLYHISTDYVFDGKKQDRPYTEEDTPHPVNSWYSITKYKGELEVLNTFKKKEEGTIVRISYPYSGVYERKLDIARSVIKRLGLKESYLGITDQKIKPTSVDDIASGLNLLLKRGTTGIFHIAGNFSPKGYITPFNFALKIAEIFKLDQTLIKPISFAEFSNTRIATRPQHTWLNTTKIGTIGLTCPSTDEALNRLKKQIREQLKNRPS